ncbi:hypothetical protein OBBRIDRAFT_570998 [Obba rivulosa]|uniref:Uncharacterized protein n=1 Tax=Obba rivulosa TaxID=1052685 RepID=A0A8E2AUW9_9APHY|nr:hypothetical protein OBBRIDRAFT_570998 [Obba rivulosa]
MYRIQTQPVLSLISAALWVPLSLSAGNWQPLIWKRPPSIAHRGSTPTSNTSKYTARVLKGIPLAESRVIL